MKKYIILLAATLGISAGILLIPAMGQADIPEVQLVTMQQFPYTETITVSGTVEAIYQKELTLSYPVVPGQIFAEVGDYVSYGDVLATVDMQATRQAVLSYVSRYADELSEGFLPDELQAVLASADTGALFEALELPQQILSPASGTLTSLSLAAGELFLPQVTAATISETNHLQLRLAVPEREIGSIAPGQQMLFTADAVEGGLFVASVRRLSPTAYQKLNGLTYETVVDVLAAVEDDFDVLRPGYTVRAEIPCGEQETLSLLPYECIQQDGDGVEYVYVYREGQAWRRDIQTGTELSTSVAVTYGLGAYERIILNAADIKKEGPVRISSGR